MPARKRATFWDRVLPIVGTTAQVATADSAVFAGLVFWRLSNSERDYEVRQWQQVVVDQILEQCNDPQGLTFDQILDAYHREATSAQGVVSLRSSELKPYALKAILLDLQTLAAISRHSNGNYVKNTSTPNPRLEATYRSQEAIYSIIDFLTTHGGEFTPSELQQELDLSIPNDEYHRTVNELIAHAMVRRGQDGRLWVAANYPPANK